MPYTVENFKTRKELEDAVAAGREVRCWQPDFKGTDLRIFTGRVIVEGPHAPEQHSWKAEVELKDGVIVKVEDEVVDAAPTHTKPAKKKHTTEVKKETKKKETKKGFFD